MIGDEETQAAVSQVITNLDKPKPQVLIKVAFLEVTHNDSKDLGVDASYLHQINNSTTGIVSTAFGVAQQTSGGFYKVLSDKLLRDAPRAAGGQQHRGAVPSHRCWLVTTSWPPSRWARRSR